MKLTKEDIDKVRHIEGFPIAKDEDIIALSNPPYYTACPNPFIEDFIKEHGKPYDEATDDYHREPFAADVSEGKMIRFIWHTHIIQKYLIRLSCDIFCTTQTQETLFLMGFVEVE
jgi:hypothetical protein